MSIKVMTQVWATKMDSHTDKLVLLALADAADEDGRCFPGMANLVLKCSASERTIQRSLAALEAAGYITRQFTGRSTAYTVTTVNLTPQTRQSDTPVNVSTRQDDTSDPSTRRVRPVNGAPPYRTVKEPSKKRQRKPAPVIDEPPPSNLNVEAWHRWEQYRKQIRKPIHPASRLSAQRKLAGFGTDQAAVVEQSIANTWQGLFPLKDEPRANASTSEPHDMPAVPANVWGH